VGSVVHFCLLLGVMSAVDWCADSQLSGHILLFELVLHASSFALVICRVCVRVRSSWASWVSEVDFVLADVAARFRDFVAVSG